MFQWKHVALYKAQTVVTGKKQPKGSTKTFSEGSSFSLKFSFHLSSA